MFTEIFFWFLLIIVNAFIFLITYPPRKWNELLGKRLEKKQLIKICFVAFISDLIIHLIIAIDNYAEVLMWIKISFPYVMFINFIILGIFVLIIKFSHKI